ncbi:hypothetical protein JL720_13273 [Aureococcus anophagefferens]|nr:hypothetical protein JL720_13273 [Aureococcus anophagefferens]
MTFRGHVDSVNSCCWQPYSNNICTASGDKTVSIWDARSALCVQTFYGHSVQRGRTRVIQRRFNVSQHPCNKVGFDRSATRIVCASDDGLLRGYSTEDLSQRAGAAAATRTPSSASPSTPRTRLVSTSTDCTFRIWS